MRFLLTLHVFFNLPIAIEFNPDIISNIPLKFLSSNKCFETWIKYRI